MYSLWDIHSKPFVEGFFELPKAIGRAAIQDGTTAGEARNDNEKHYDKLEQPNRDELSHSTRDRFSSLPSMSVQ